MTTPHAGAPPAGPTTPPAGPTTPPAGPTTPPAGPTTRPASPAGPASVADHVVAPRSRAVPVRTAVVTVSDRCSRGEAVDGSGPTLVAGLRAAGYAAGEPTVVADGADSVEGAIRAALAGGARVVLTTGGTGVGPRDRTPEGSARLIDLDLPGLADAIRAAGAAGVPAAVLSRARAGVTAPQESGVRAVVVNLPGSPRGAGEGLTVLLPVLPHLLDQLDGGWH